MIGEIKFKRARNKENKEIRFTQIKNAAIELFDEIPYHEISLSKIGEKINFTRANLYKYISSKEDIFLFILLDETKAAVKEMEEHLIKEQPIETNEFATIWTDILIRHPRFLKLLSLLYMTIEQNANLDALIKFKNSIASVTSSVMNIIMHNLPSFTFEEAAKVMDYAMSLVISRYSVCYPAKIQKEAVEKSDFPYVFPDFEKTYREGLVLIINGLKLSKF